VKTSPDVSLHRARDRGYELYTPTPDHGCNFERSPFAVSGTLSNLLQESDVVVDATPAGTGQQYTDVYRQHGVPAVFQGGESADIVEASFVAACWEDKTVPDRVRVVSCNTTGIARLLSTLDTVFGVDSASATLVRRGGDPSQTDRGPINDILPDPVATPSHHADDLAQVLPKIPVHTAAFRVPATLMHVHSLQIQLTSEPAVSEVRRHLQDVERIAMLPEGLGLESCAALLEASGEFGRSRNDLWENVVWGDSLSIDSGTLSCLQAVNQRSIVIPEVVDAVRLLSTDHDIVDSQRITNRHLGVGTFESWLGGETARAASPGTVTFDE
jgi:glyceraldehyde-3-phosphate dehydrogenase (NAD(P))